MTLRNTWKEWTRGYILKKEHEQSLRFRGPLEDRLPEPVDMDDYRIIFTARKRGGYEANIFLDGVALAQDFRIGRIERGVKNPENGRELRVKLNLFDSSVIMIAEIEYD